MFHKNIKLWKSAIVFMLLVFTFSGSLFASTIRVKRDGSGDFTNIQTAIDAAEIDDTVKVLNSRKYQENLKNIDKVVLLMPNGATVTSVFDNTTEIEIDRDHSGVIRGNSCNNGTGVFTGDGSEIGAYHFHGGTIIDRGIMAFNTSGIPAGANIINALIKYYTTSLWPSTVELYFMKYGGTTSSSPPDSTTDDFNNFTNDADRIYRAANYGVVNNRIDHTALSALPSTKSAGPDRHFTI